MADPRELHSKGVSAAYKKRLEANSSSLGTVRLQRVATEALASAIWKGDIGRAVYVLNHIPEWQREAVAKWLKEFGLVFDRAHDDQKRWIVVSVIAPLTKKLADAMMSRCGKEHIRLPPPPPPPDGVATRRDNKFKPLDQRWLPSATEIDHRQVLDTKGNAPGMGKQVPSAEEQSGQNAIKGSAGPPKQNLPDHAKQFADQFSQAQAPERCEGRTNTFIRSTDVRNTVLRRANGFCECCGKEGFKTESGTLYLETHHVIPLSEDGPDAEWNVVAICPDDHRRAHFSADRIALSKQLASRLVAIYPGAEICLRDLLKRQSVIKSGVTDSGNSVEL
jgi:hypothetical protein